MTSEPDAALLSLQPPVQTVLPSQADAAKPDDSLPLPAALTAQVNFWKRVYTEIDSQQGYLHDARHLDVVYATLWLPPEWSDAQTRQLIKTHVEQTRAILHTLAQGKRANLSPDEAHILAQWPAAVERTTLQAAAQNVRFQAGQRDKFLAGVLRSRRWMPAIAAIFAAAHLPVELAALPHVESSFDIQAYSKAHAAGMWQFTAATARRFMRMNQAVDERYDPLTSTYAAAALLRENYRSLGVWPLAITAYNHGAAGMAQAVKNVGSNDIATIVAQYKSPRFGFASRNFYTELLAAYAVASHPEDYFGQLDDVPPTELLTLECDAYYRITSLASALDIDVDTLRQHNPALRPAVWLNLMPVPRGYSLRLPASAVPHDADKPGDAAAQIAQLSARLGHLPARERLPTAIAVTGPSRATVATSATLPASVIPWDNHSPSQNTPATYTKPSSRFSKAAPNWLSELD